MTGLISSFTILSNTVGDSASGKEISNMAKRLFKCFECGKLYDDEQSAMKCHNAPIQRILVTEGKQKPRFLGN